MALVHKNGVWHSTWRQWATKLDGQGKEIRYRKQVSKVISPDKAAAQQFERTRKTNTYHRRAGLTLKNISVKQFFDEYLQTISKVKKRHQSVLRDEIAQRTFMKAMPYVRNVDEIDTRVMEKYKAILTTGGGLKQKPLRQSSINRELGSLSSMFKTAIDWGYMERSKAPSIEFYKVDKRASDRRLAPKEIDLVLTKVWDPWRDLIILGLIFGTRSGEACHFQKIDVDLDSKAIRVRPVEWKEDGASIQWQPKTKQSIRSIPIPPKYVHYMKRLLPKYKGPWLISQEGERVKETVLSSMVRKFCVKLELPRFRFHDLRHTWFSQCNECGANAMIVSEAGGHGSLETTQKTYTHFRTEYRQKEISKLQYPIKTRL
jgi:integrase